LLIIKFHASAEICHELQQIVPLLEREDVDDPTGLDEREPYKGGNSAGKLVTCPAPFGESTAVDVESPLAVASRSCVSTISRRASNKMMAWFASIKRFWY
jgi:hypothetical protein